MLYEITHTTTYEYPHPVTLEPHTVRLRPRCDSLQKLQDFSIHSQPHPTGLSPLIDWEGNGLLRLWWPQEPTEQLEIITTAVVEPLSRNPYDYLLEPEATKLPFDYPADIAAYLAPCRQADRIAGPVKDLAQEIHQVTDEPLPFLSRLCDQLYQRCEQIFRATGEPLPPAQTLAQQAGSCRDLAVVFIHACRSKGLAARFVSGYSVANLEKEEKEPELHAWAEVYLPGAGWRGYDPTLGLAVSDQHIPLVANGNPAHAAPITGTFRGQGDSEMRATVMVNVLARES